MINRAIETVMGKMSEKAMRLDRLYVLDGRHRPDHKLHNSYDGLLAKADELEDDAAWMPMRSLQRIKTTAIQGLLASRKIAKKDRKEPNYLWQHLKVNILKLLIIFYQ